MVDFALAMLVLALILLAVLALVAAADRAAQAAAWRKIAQERRWNSENRR
jgi:Tfp pilus assembly protein PilV